MQAINIQSVGFAKSCSRLGSSYGYHQCYVNSHKKENKKDKPRHSMASTKTNSIQMNFNTNNMSNKQCFEVVNHNLFSSHQKVFWKVVCARCFCRSLKNEENKTSILTPRQILCSPRHSKAWGWKTQVGLVLYHLG